MAEAGATRWWTVDDANSALPRITEIVERARVAAAAMQERTSRLRRATRGNGHGENHGESGAFNDAVRELARDGIMLRDVDRGLVDFPAQTPTGRTFWLCWAVGEPEVAWWHWPEDGFAGRTPLSEPPA